MRLAASFTMLALLFCASIHAQQSETITVEVTNVDAVVTDSSGKRVSNLGKDDFEVLADGRKMPVASVTAVSSPEQAKPARVLLLFDQGSLSITTRKPAVAAARDFVARHVRPADRIMIMTMTRSLVSRLTWTSDRVAVNATLDEIEREAFLPRLETERRRVEQQIRNSILDERTAPVPGQISFETLLSAARAYANNATREANQTLISIFKAQEEIPAGPHRKVLVLIGEGLPLNPGSDIFEFLRNVQSREEAGTLPLAIRQGARTAAPLADAANFDISTNARKVTGAARDRGVVMYTIAPTLQGGSATPVERTGISNSDVTFSTTTAMMSGYQMLANETGGLALIGTPAEEAMNQVAADLSSYYSIAYRGAPPRSAAALVVKARGDYRTRAVLAGEPLSPDAMVQQRVVAHHAGAIESNDLQIELQGAATPIDGNKQKVALKILIPVGKLKLEKAGAEVTGGFTVFISTGVKGGEISAVTRQTHEIRWPAEALPQLLDKKMTFAVDVVITPPRDQISVGVLDRLSQQTGYERWNAGS